MQYNYQRIQKRQLKVLMNIGLRLFTCAVYLTGDAFTEIGFIFFISFLSFLWKTYIRLNNQV